MRAWLKELRTENGFTQDVLASASGVTRQAYSAYENGSRRPSPEVAQKIAKELGFDWTRFYEPDSKQ